MKENKNTKKALFGSILSMIVCVGLLVGSTFAWFTDSVTSKGNVIASGNLSIRATYQDVDMESGTLSYQVPGFDRVEAIKFSDTKVDINDDNQIINENLWEPGVMNAKLITVNNEGSLAAKIKLHFDNQDNGLEAALWYDFIQVKDNEVTGSFTKRDMSTLSDYASQIELPLLSKESVSFILLYGMKESAGNEYMDKTFTSDVSILATQASHEEDSFGSDYDKGAKYSIDVWDGSVATSEELAAATNTETKVVSVDSAEVLAAFAKAVNEGNSYAGYTIKLNKNLDLQGFEWTPIGRDDDHEFQGVFDGQNNAILNLSINGKGDGINEYAYVGFIGVAKDTTIQNLTVEGDVKGTNINAAGIVGKVRGVSKLSNLTNKANVESTFKAGGIAVSSHSTDLVLENCMNEGDISTTSNDGAAGIVAYAQTGTFTIKDCVNNGNIDAPRASGGIISVVSDGGNGLVTGCVNNGDITSEVDKVAGIISINSSKTNVTISDCVNNGTITGQDVSGISGGLEYTHSNKPNVNNGEINATRTRYISETEATLNSDVDQRIEVLLGSTLIINKGNYTGDRIDNYGTLKVNGGNFTKVSNFDNHGTLTVKDGEFKQIRSFKNAFTTIKGGEIAKLSTEGTFTGKLIIEDGKIGGNLTLVAGGGIIEINGGHFTYNTFEQFMINNKDDNAVVTINGGTFDWSHKGRFNIGEKEEVLINGGTFKVDITTSKVSLAEGKQCINNGDGTWTVK